MAYLSLSGESVGKFVASGNKNRIGRAQLVTRTDTPARIIRYVYYAFVFSLLFEAMDIGIGSPLPKVFGLALAVLALFQPRLCYKPPPAFWWFAMYLVAFTLSGAYLVLGGEGVRGLAGSVIMSLLTLVQLLILFCVSYNLMKHEGIIKGTLWALAGSAIVLAMLQFLGVTSEVVAQERVTAFQANANSFATSLSLGLLALLGLAYGREKPDWKARLLFWLGFGILAIAIVQTGSRGAVAALVGSLSVFLLKGKSLATKLKFGLVGLAGIVVLAWASYNIDAVRVRWERTFYEGSLAGRERILPEAVGMILEKPLTGWGPVNHFWELGSRLGKKTMDPHNLYLWILEEVGVLGAIPFFVGLWFCWRAAWRARHSIQGVLPMAMLLFLLVISLAGTTHNRKLFWLALAYAAASSTYVAVRSGIRLRAFRATGSLHSRQPQLRKSAS